MDDADPVRRFDDIVSSHESTFVLFYRGHWCPFCMAHIRQLATLSPKVQATGATTLIVTAEGAEHLAAVTKQTGYTGQTINDPDLKLVTELSKRDIIDIAITDKGGYPHGMSQPGLIVIDRQNKVLEKWAIVPSIMNLFGAKDRPDLEQVWANAQATAHGKNRPNASYSLMGVGSGLKQKLFGGEVAPVKVQ